MKILMVCLGNICRSPLAQGILQHKCNEAGLSIEVESAGTSGYHAGERPHTNTIRVAKENGIDISNYRSSMFRPSDFDKYDLIYAMDYNNYLDIKRSSKHKWNEAKIKLFLNELHPGKNEEVPDPWYGTYEGFQSVYMLIDQTCDKIMERIKQSQPSSNS